MQVPDSYLSIIPRSHYKWAGVKKIEPIYKTVFVPVRREKTVLEYVTPSGDAKKCDEEVSKDNNQIMSYDKKGKIIEYSLTGSTITYC